MRIISGSLKGVRLTGFKKNSFLRPMTDRVKESVFNILAPQFNQQVLFLDLFSGTGNLALEALSRGASKAHAVESHYHSIAIINKNRNLLKNPKRLIIHKKDVFSFIQSSKEGPFHIIIADPPFALKAGEKILKNLVKSSLYIVGSVVVIETGRGEELEENYSCFYLFSKKSFSDKTIWFYEAKK